MGGWLDGWQSENAYLYKFWIIWKAERWQFLLSLVFLLTYCVSFVLYKVCLPKVLFGKYSKYYIWGQVEVVEKELLTEVRLDFNFDSLGLVWLTFLLT